MSFPVFELPCAESVKMYRPSRDQSVGRLEGAVLSRASSCPTPLVAFWYTLLPEKRKAIRLPSGDQTGFEFDLELNVNREAPPRTRSCNQMSEIPVCGSRREIATALPSGEIAGHCTIP